MNKFFFVILLFYCLVSNAQDEPPVVTGSGNQPYCPLSQIPIVETFDITDPDDTSAEAIYIQISTGYQLGEDVLFLTGTHPAIVASWDNQQGKLTLSGIGGLEISYVDLIAAVYDVVFQSSSNMVNGERYFSITLGEANYLPSTDHYYEYISDPGITWSEAFNIANNSTYYGLQGYLATVTSEDEAQLTGEQAEGAGWLGGSDEATEGVWEWMNGPELGVVFWNGGVNGSTSNYANWNVDSSGNLVEPNNCCGGEDYLHVTFNVGPPGKWNDLPNQGGTGDYYPQGYIVEYGGMPGDPTLQISTSTSIYVPAIETFQSNSICGEGSMALQATTDSDDILWFDVPTGGIPLASGTTFITPILNTTTTFYALASANGCLEGQRQAVTATIYPMPVIDDMIDLKNCDEDGVPDGITAFNLHEADDMITFGNSSLYTITYYESVADAQNAINEVNATPYINDPNNTVFARIESTDGCFDVATVNLLVSTTSFPPNSVQELNACDDDGSADGLHEFDLTAASQQFIDLFPSGQNLSVHYYYTLQDAQLEQNEISNLSNYINQTPYTEILYVRVESDDNGDCFGIGPNLKLQVFPMPDFEVYPPEGYCTGGDLVLLETYNANGNFFYEWTNSSGEVIGSNPSVYVDSGGSYSVMATSIQGCLSDTVMITVEESSIANIGSDDVEVTHFTENNTIVINNNGSNLGIGNYEFALDYGLYQEEAFFNHVPAGNHLLSVRDINGCGVATLEVNIMGFPKFFTPNGDGYNDVWNIKGLNGELAPESNIRIFDRLGKLVKQISPYGEGWNGSFNGELMISSDYWYLATLIFPTGETTNVSGHFSLKR